MEYWVILHTFSLKMLTVIKPKPKPIIWFKNHSEYTEIASLVFILKAFLFLLQYRIYII